MKFFLSAFLADDDGAVTVDFVGLTAAICLLGALVMVAIGDGTEALAGDIEQDILSVCSGGSCD
ncbi:hypothetical protein MWU60_07160 [Yoonia sp. F2084L]|uniref:hypothetical protein n=1 Tax=Yoonia sp. F2084L TaxID=2926419 RepID=UPI001FF3C9A6|nr:hypothetical protein [Yoonia sp. F2084L]MCK0095346.1 hypothetical protein [Yoonia sp. F2084L]